MSKITFRADDDLVAQLEEFDASKSEIMREALRSYLDEPTAGESTRADAPIDDYLVERIDVLVADRLERGPTDVNVNIGLEGLSVADVHTDQRDVDVETSPDLGEPSADRTAETTCAQCGADLSDESVYCPNCGEKATHRVFCECGDELRSDWAFCPTCGRRTPAADVLDRS